jgi:uncharacterized protein (TIGR04255 family)
MSLDFERPPINEVVLGVLFPQIATLRAEAIGLFWARIRKDFPSVVQQPVYFSQFSLPVQSAELFTLPRFWFLSQDNTRLIQLQNGAFLYNWRKQNDEYPRFHQIFPEFLGHLETFQKFLKEDLEIGSLPIATAELTYINLFGKLESLEHPIDYKRVVKTFSVYSAPEANLALENFQHVDSFRSPSGDQMIVTQRSGRMPSDNRPVFVLELKVMGPLSVSLEDWFSNAHNRINESFVNLTSSEMQMNVWRKR